ncbi:hypothetical protein ACFL59_00290 [Planctomycetota bacterium]
MRSRACRFTTVAVAMLAIVAVLTASSNSYAGGGGKIEQARKRVRQSDHRSSTNSSSHRERSRSDDDDSRHGDDDDVLDSFLATIALYTLTAPFWAPHVALGDDFDATAFFPAYPYAKGADGSLRITGRGGLTEREASARDDLKPWSARLGIQDSYDFDGVNRLAGSFRLDTYLRLGLSTDWVWLYEDLKGGRADRLVLGDANLLYRFAQHERVQFFTGLGGRLMTDKVGTEGGVNFTYGFEIFPIEPLAISATVDMGGLGETFLFHGRAAVSAIVNRCELHGGYDYLAIGGVSFHGPVFGVRVWF